MPQPQPNRQLPAKLADLPLLIVMYSRGVDRNVRYLTSPGILVMVLISKLYLFLKELRLQLPTVSQGPKCCQNCTCRSTNVEPVHSYNGKSQFLSIHARKRVQISNSRKLHVAKISWFAVNKLASWNFLLLFSSNFRK